MTHISESAFGIYVHWPFCAAKCPYCDFNSHVRVRTDEELWAKGIARELNYLRSLQGNSPPVVQTIFFGGGTPSLMSGKSVAGVLNAISSLWSVSRTVEVTLESNPASADAARFCEYRRAGVNRLSLGVQALNDAALKALGRLHSAAEAKAALRIALNTFERVSLDLIYARPGQTARQWRAELAEALGFGTEHLSLYQLTIEPGTAFAALAHRGKLNIPKEDAAADLYEVTQELTEAEGLPAYEISNHARPGAECRHNLLYWRYGAYAGVGPGAHGRLDLNGLRYATSAERIPERWSSLIAEQGHAFVQWDALSREDAAREHMIMNLRLSEGLDLVDHETRWGIAADRTRLLSLEEDGLISVRDGRLTATPKGRLVLNAVIASAANCLEPESCGAQGPPRETHRTPRSTLQDRDRRFHPD